MIIWNQLFCIYLKFSSCFPLISSGLSAPFQFPTDIGFLAHTINCYLVILKKRSYFSISVSVINLLIFKESRDSATIWMVAVLCLVSLVMRQATGFIYLVLWCDRTASLWCLGYSMGLTAIKDATVMVRG